VDFSMKTAPNAELAISHDQHGRFTWFMYINMVKKIGQNSGKNKSYFNLLLTFTMLILYPCPSWAVKLVN